MNNQIDRIHFPAEMCNVAQVEPFVQQIAASFRLDEDTKGNILVSLTEAVTNAIVHGCKCDGGKHVHVEVERNEKKNILCFRVIDQGEGFNFNSIPDPTAPENLLKIGGRGVFLMRNLSERTEFSDEGRCVNIFFRI